jgi:molybdopterin biosynthesis enzyme
LMSMVAANGIVTIPEGIASFDAGQVVDVSIIGSLTS